MSVCARARLLIKPINRIRNRLCNIVAREKGGGGTHLYVRAPIPLLHSASCRVVSTSFGKMCVCERLKGANGPRGCVGENWVL